MLTSKNTRLESSPKKFHLDETIVKLTTEVNVTDVHSLNASQLVNIVGKIVKVGKIFEVHSKRKGKELRKQECTIGDSGSRCHVVLWEGDVGKLKEDACY